MINYKIENGQDNFKISGSVNDVKISILTLAKMVVDEELENSEDSHSGIELFECSCVISNLIDKFKEV